MNPIRHIFPTMLTSMTGILVFFCYTCGFSLDKDHLADDPVKAIVTDNIDSATVIIDASVFFVDQPDLPGYSLPH